MAGIAIGVVVGIVVGAVVGIIAGVVARAVVGIAIGAVAVIVAGAVVGIIAGVVARAVAGIAIGAVAVIVVVAVVGIIAGVVARVVAGIAIGAVAVIVAGAVVVIVAVAEIVMGVAPASPARKYRATKTSVCSKKAVVTAAWQCAHLVAVDERVEARALLCTPCVLLDFEPQFSTSTQLSSRVCTTMSYQPNQRVRL